MLYLIQINEQQRALLVEALKAANVEPSDLGDWAEVELLRSMLGDGLESDGLINDFTS